MDLLIDTHAVIWFITDNNRLPTKTKHLIENKRNNCFISMATFWEIAIKYSIGRLDLNSDLDNIFKIIEDTGFEILPITTIHILENANLKFHHQDPLPLVGVVTNKEHGYLPCSGFPPAQRIHSDATLKNWSV